MKVGIFHPALNFCGGAEWVGVNVISCIKERGHSIILLSNEKLDQPRIQRLFGMNVNVDAQMIFPLEFFQPTDLHNVYTDFVRSACLKSKCDIVIDTFSNALLPGVNITYIHFPFHWRIPKLQKGDIVRKLKNYYYHPYLSYERKQALNEKRLILANSNYTIKWTEGVLGSNVKLLYPPIPRTFFNHEDRFYARTNTVVSVDRISPDKYLTSIPVIAKLTDKRIRFVIIGLRESEKELNRIMALIRANGVQNRVSVMTDVPREKLQRILRTSKVFLHPAQGEHFGVSIAEAMASGCIPIVHDSGGPREFVPELFRFQGAEEAATKIERAIFGWTPNDAERFGSIAQQFSQENFSRQLLNLFEAYQRNQ